jgi:TolB-like protein
VNWPSVERLFAAALDTPAEGREALLDSDPDDTVRAEVRRLLARHDALSRGHDPFLATLDIDRAATLVESVEPDDPPVIGRYEIVRRLGFGATGVVYLARDPSLARQVALKLLSPHLSHDATGIRRFTDEARAASRLDSPHIAAVYEIGRSEDGRLFIAMAYHEGETLRERIARGALPVAEAVRIAGDVADGLSAAHAKGIIHRDIKPENILLTERGACIVDFGIAKVAGETLTRTGAALGTAAYMSPEQTRGTGVDHRSDLWSLGVVLYEMLTGQRPFRADGGEALIFGIRYDAAEPVTALRPDVEPALARLVDRCLVKEPEGRYQSAANVLSALRAPVPSSAPALATRWRWAGAIVLVAGGLSGWHSWSGGGKPTSAVSTADLAVAVLPYRVVGPGVEYLREGMVDLLSFNIEGIKGLRKIDPATVITAWRRMQGTPSDAVDTASALKLARQVQARYLVTGSAVQLGEGIRLVAEVRDIARGEFRGLAQVSGSIDSVSWLVDQLTLELLRLNLLPSDGDHQPVSLSGFTTTSLPALKAYLAGEREYRVAHWRGAAQQYLRAIELDSTFARAMYRWLKASQWSGGPRAHPEYGRRLARLVDRLPERDRMLIRGDLGLKPDDRDYAAKISTLESLTLRYPDDVEAWVALGEVYFHTHGVSLLPTSTYRNAFTKALQLNPYYGEPYVHLIDDAFLQLDSAGARRLIDEYAVIDDSRKACSFQLAYDLVWGPETARDRALEALDTIAPLAAWSGCLPMGPLAAPPHALDRIGHMYQTVADTSSDAWSTLIAFHQLRLKELAPRGQIARVQEALAQVESLTGTAAWWVAGWQILLHLSGSPDSLAAHRAARKMMENPHPRGMFWIGVLALEERRWADADQTLRALDRRAHDLATGGDTILTSAVTSHAAALRAYMGLVRGGGRLRELEVALLLLQPRSIYAPEAAYLRFQIGKRLLEWGQLREAERYFLSFGPRDFYTSEVEWYLGRISQALGRPDEAVEHYRRFITWWQYADPGLRGPLQEAQVALSRLGTTNRTASAPVRTSPGWRGKSH